jgi:hypothetical protein
MEVMKRYLVPFVAILFSALGLSPGCSDPAVTYHNAEFGFTVLIPQSWEVIDDPVDSIGKPVKNTVVFRSDSSRNAERVSIRVDPEKTIYSTVTDITHIPHVERKIYEYGKSGFIVESRYLQDPEKELAISYYIEHNDCLYMIFFNSKRTTEKVHVSIDGYGKVN